MQELQRSNNQVKLQQNWGIICVSCSHTQHCTLKPSDRSPIVRIQYYQTPFISIGMAMIIGLLI